MAYEHQRAEKVRNLKEWTGLQDVEFVSVGEAGLRDRTDLILSWNQGRFHLGLWSLGDYAERTLVDLRTCPMMSPALSAWFQDFRSRVHQLPESLGDVIRMGSLRLRVGPQGERGVWLDFSNVSIKGLLDERVWLESLLADGVVVEIGQRRKILVRKGERLGLDEAAPRAWFASWNVEKRAPIPLLLSVGGFSQPSLKSNQALVEVVVRAVREAIQENAAIPNEGPARVLELGAGNGNLSLALLALRQIHVTTVESDARAVEALGSQAEARSDRLEVLRANFFKATAALIQRAKHAHVWVCDPSRGGLKGALDWMAPTLEGASEGQGPRLIYISCDPKAFAQDMKILTEKGVRFTKAVIVDQFPQSHHFECVVW